LKVDFHVHTHYSPDSRIKPAELAQKAKELGIVPAITDHYSFGAIPEMKKAGIDFIPGEELSVVTPHGRADLIGLFMNEGIRRGVDFYEATDLLKAQGAIIYAPHPFDPFRVALNDEKLLREAQVIEVFNAHSSDKFDRQAEEFAKKEGKLMAAGSDAHFLFEFGYTYVELELDELEPKKLLEALRTGKITGERTHKLRRLAHRVGSTLLKPFI
jgi:predicted metal-dependent phosphoesterase TrpH